MARFDGGGPRRFEVGADRVERWVAGFASRHPVDRREAGPARVVLHAADGAVAALEPFVPNDRYAASLASWAAYPRLVAAVLVRRGGYAVGLADGVAWVAHKVGTRHVQSRTAAGGWSQQRFARRRENQADALVTAVAGHLVQVLGAAAPSAVVLGGDRRLVGEMLADPRLAALAGLPRRELYDLPDPRRAVLDDAVRRARSVRVTLEEP